MSFLCILCCLLALLHESPGQRTQSMVHQLSSSPFQHNTQDVTYCRIPKSELVASAETTATRVLQGICNPRELKDRFTNLENQIVEQFNVLKTMVLNIEDKLLDQDQKIQGQHRKIHRAMAAVRNARKLKENKVGNSNKFSKNSGTENSPHLDGPNSGNSALYDYYDDEYSYYDGEFIEDSPSVRVPEISRYNSTIQTEQGKRIFTYYWTVKDLPYRMKNWGWRRSLRSDSFYIFPYGYKMYIRIYPNQKGKNIYIHVGITHGDYDAALEWPFKLKHKIQVVDHSLPGEDLSSRVWDPTQLCSGWNWRRPDASGDNYECVGLGFPHDTVYSRKYLHNNSITIKLTVFLD